MNDFGIQMPDGIEAKNVTRSYGCFVVQPLERGFLALPSATRCAAYCYPHYVAWL